MARPLVALLAAAALLGLGAAAPASAQVLQSPNVSVLGKQPQAAGAIGARFSPDGKVMYVTGVTGLQTFDVSDAANPKPLGVLPLPHFENEDVDVGRDTVVISNDPSFTELGQLYLIDVSNPATPTLRSTLTTHLPGGLPLEGSTGNGHIANCIQDCRFLYTTGTEEGLTIYDLRDLDAPKFVKTVALPAGKASEGEPGFTHDVYVDPAGVAWVTGEDGTFGYDVSDPVNPKLLLRSDEDVVNTGGGLPGDDGSGPLDFLHHNSQRTSVQLAPASAAPQPPATPGGPPVAPGASGGTPAANRPRPKVRLTRAEKRRIARTCRRQTRSKRAQKRCTTRRTKSALKRKRDRAAMRRSAQRTAGATARVTDGGLGDVMAVTEEDYLKPGCEGQGSFQTWQITAGRNSDGTQKLELLDSFTTETNELASLAGRSPATANCSAHWFDEAGGLVAQGWYDQGVRFLDISNPRDIRQVGFYATAGTFWAAYFAPSDPKRETVYALDVAGGIDVLRIDRSSGAPRAVRAPARRSAYPTPEVELERSPTWGFVCPLPGSRR